MTAPAPVTFRELVDDVERAYPDGAIGRAAAFDVVERARRLLLRAHQPLHVPPTQLERAVARAYGIPVDFVVDKRWPRRRSR